ncbi:hypothetical protein LZ30DRAFT_386262 [Colletotrichum cereale]|nr:hypothetical protein LZ30DRAFT_386262 [Colletotrichum cereale]
MILYLALLSLRAAPGAVAVAVAVVRAPHARVIEFCSHTDWPFCWDLSDNYCVGKHPQYPYTERNYQNPPQRRFPARWCVAAVLGHQAERSE